jgi:hypothetical protein
MPTSLALGSAYGLCHGDIHSALLLESLAQVEHHPGGNEQAQSHDTHQGMVHDNHQVAGQDADLVADPDAYPVANDSAHAHDDATARAFADNHCGFSIGAGMLLVSTLDLPTDEPVAQPSPFLPVPAVAWQITYLQPPPRAPPRNLLT